MQDYFTPQGSNTELKINSIKKHIEATNCKHLKMDISSMNALEASKIVALCSTNHYLKYPKGIVDCLVKSIYNIELVKPLILDNIKFLVKA